MIQAFKPVCERLLDPAFDNVLLVCHANPDGDTLGSAFALCAGLRKLNKQAQVYFEPRKDSTFDYITKELAPQDFVYQHLVTVDVAAMDLLGQFVPGLPVDIAIDHHKNNRISAGLTLCLPDRAACGEIVFELLQAMQVDIDEYMARCLYTAIATDTGRFCYANTTHRTFATAASLSRLVSQGHFADINKRVFETASATKMRLEAFAASQARFFRNGTLCALTVDPSQMTQLQVTGGDFEGVINVLRRFEGVQAALLIRYQGPGYKVSLRAEPGWDCAQVCQVFGGGGHAGAAGCTVQGEPAQVLQAVLEVIEEQWQ